MQFIRGLKAIGKENGQVLIMLALLLPLLCIFVGFAIDFGFAFLVRTNLAKGADAAALATMRNLGKGTTQAQAIGQLIFNLNNNHGPNLFVTAPSANIQISTSGDPVVNVIASAKIHTFFIGMAGFPTLTVAASSQATRPPIILSLVLDKSGSMNDNGGAAALPGSVEDFVGYFLEGTDQLGETSFSWTGQDDVNISSTFQSSITSSVKSITFDGATYAYGGLQDAEGQITGVSSPPANAVKVAVFFTDGWANSIQSTVAGNPVNFGGCAPAEFSVGWCNGVSCWNGTNGKSIGGTVVSTTDTAATCDGVSTFTPQDTALGSSAKLTINNIATEADYRAVQLANTMRGQGITVYSIGLGDKINQTYLYEMANDPASPEYNANEPSGIAAFAPTADALDSAFQVIASNILLRLTQ